MRVDRLEGGIVEVDGETEAGRGGDGKRKQG